jgi:hypothetical protein
MHVLLSDSEIREIVRDVSKKVLADIAPEEAEVSIVLIDPLIDQAATGELTVEDDVKEDFAFDGSELVVGLVVLMVWDVIGEFAKKFGEGLAEITIDMIKEKLAERKERKKYIRYLMKRIDIPANKRKRRKMIRAIVTELSKQ